MKKSRLDYITGLSLIALVNTTSQQPYNYCATFVTPMVVQDAQRGCPQAELTVSVILSLTSLWQAFGWCFFGIGT